MITRRLANDPAEAALLAAVQRMRIDEPSQIDVERALQQVRARMSVRRRWYVPASVAAAAVIVAAAGGALFRAYMSRQTTGHVVAGGEGTRVFDAPIGKRSELLLADGTHVVLGPGSQLRVSAALRRGRRDVTLSGEALFDVKHDAVRTFVVHTSGAIVQDIGTTFSVHADGGGNVRVVVTSGEVRLRGTTAPGADSGVVLRAEDIGVVRGGRHAVVLAGAVSDDDLAWTQGRLIFHDASFNEVAADVQRWYGVQLRAANGLLASRHITAAFSHDSAQHVVRVIALALGAAVEWRGGTAILYPEQ